MNPDESALTFAIAGDPAIGILARPAGAACDTGVLILVGGPQYRAGSHRQFVLLARDLAGKGYPAFRFDYRGMGDSAGTPVTFDAADTDVAAAIDCFLEAAPGVRRIVLWGLCDAASAALLYWERTRDRRIAGMCLLNPWVRSEETLARTQVQHYYGHRLLQAGFWKKLLRGEVELGRRITEFATALWRARAAGAGAPAGFQARMAAAARDFAGPMLLILSENDYVAKEFLEHRQGNAAWQVAASRDRFSEVTVAGADHTFSSREHRDRVAELCRNWLDQRASP